MIRAKIDMQRGIKHLRKANEALPDNIEIMVKLAGVLFQENGTNEDILFCRDLLEKAIQHEPNNAEALLMQGKTYHKLGEW